jgi:hypothetical protein
MIAVKAAPAERVARRLLALERADARLSARMHRDQIERNRVQAELRALRCGLATDAARVYRDLRALESFR